MRGTLEADARAANLRIERVAHPNGHFGGSGERKYVGMQNFRSACGERVRFVVAQVVQELRLRVFVGVRGVDSVDVGPDHQLVSIDDVGNDRAGKIGAVAAERGDAAVGSSADETGDDGDDVVFEQRSQHGAATALGLFEVRLRIAEGVAGEHEVGRCNGNGGDSGTFESGGGDFSA